MKASKRHNFEVWCDVHLVFIFDASYNPEELKDFGFKRPPDPKQKKLIGRFIGVSIPDDVDLKVTVEIDPSSDPAEERIGRGFLNLPTGDLTVGTGGPDSERSRRVGVPPGLYAVDIHRSYIDTLHLALRSVSSAAEVGAQDNWFE